MGLNVSKLIVSTGKTIAKQKSKLHLPERSIFVTNPESMAIENSLLGKIPEMFKPLSKREIAEIKPSEFEKLLASRTDIPKELTEIKWYERYLNSPEQLSLYDTMNNFLLTRNIDNARRKEILIDIIKHGSEKAEVLSQTLPNLIKKGYDLDTISKLSIDNINAPFVEKILNKIELINKLVQKKYNKLFTEQVYRKTMFRENKSLLQDEYQKITNYCDSQLDKIKIDTYNRILRQINKKNYKYLEDCFTLTGDIDLIGYWNKNTTQIYKKYLSETDPSKNYKILELLSRKNHCLKSVVSTIGDSELNHISYRLLEFKNFDKFKNISLDNFNTLTNTEKKEFINSYISALSIKDAMFTTQSHIFEGFEQLSSRMKIFNHLDTSNNETFLKSYSETLKKLMDTLPQKERLPIYKKINYGEHSAKYRKQNPIPAMCDDISKLPVKTEIINGKEYLVSEIPAKTDLITSTHCIPTGDAILNCEALEFTDPNEILCLGLHGGKKGICHAPNSYALAIKPRLGNDWWIQASRDIDSGNNASKNIVNVGNFFRGGRGNYSYIPELLKKELDLSTKEYSMRMKKLAKCTTIDEIEKIDKEMGNTIRKVLQNNQTYEGLIRPEPMGVIVGENIPLSETNQNILNYVENRGIRLIRVISQ